MLVFRRPFDLSYDRIVNYNLFSFRSPNVRAPVPMSAFLEKSRWKLPTVPLTTIVVYSRYVCCGLRTCSRKLCPNADSKY